MLVAAPSLDFPTLNLRWSKKNNTADGNLSDGDVGGAFFSVTNKLNNIGNIIDQAVEGFLLGDDGFDTDEYDQHVITHEFGHYLTALVSRSDSYGGSHGLGDKLDMTVAFDEGWSDAFSGVALNDASVTHVPTPHIYQDTYGAQQLRVFKFNLETAGVGISGWFNESSIYQIIYNLFDPDDGFGFDQVDLSFSQLFDALAGIKNTNAFNTIYTYINELKSSIPASAAAIDNLVANELLTVNDDYGSGQAMPAGLGASNNSDITPIYADVFVGVNKTLCSNTQFGAHNKLSVIRYAKFTAPTSRTYSISLTPSGNGKPGVEVYRSGNYIDGDYKTTSQAVSFNTALLSGEHVVAIYDTDNLDVDAKLNVRKCFTLRVN